MRLRITAAVVSLFTLGACVLGDPAGADAPPLQTTLSIRADLSGTPIATVVVRVTAPDITTPLAFNISTVGGVAAGSVTIPAGSSRTLALHAYDAGGVEIDSGSVILNLLPGANPTLSILLTPLPGESPITVVLGSFSVALQPTTDTLAPGDTVSVTATILDAGGNPITGPVVWATLDPKVAALVTTGQQRARVTARGPGRTAVVAIYGGIAGPAVIAVANPLWPNEPAGYTVVTDWLENSVTGGGWQDDNLLDPGDTLVRIVSDATAPLSPPNVLEFRYPIGFEAGAAPATIYYQRPDIVSNEIYVGFWWKPSDPWQDESGSNVNKILFLSSYSANVIIQLEGAPPYAIEVQLEADVDNSHLANVTCGSSPGPCLLHGNVANPTVPLGEWHRLELRVKLSSTATSRDGVLQWWMDNTLIGSYMTVNFPTDPWVLANLSPTWGGGDNVKTENDFFWYDHIHISKP